MQKHTDVHGMQRIQGLVDYLSRFLSNLTDLCEPLRQLTHKDTAWNWTNIHDKAFQKIKNAITEATVLQCFDPAELAT